MAQTPQPHVLLIENDTFLASIYKARFEAEGFKVSTAEDGIAGLEYIKKKKPDMILLDILLPKMDGFAVLEAVRADAATTDIPIILLTNLGQKDDVDKGLRLGATDYLIKVHVKPADIVTTVRDILNIK